MLAISLIYIKVSLNERPRNNSILKDILVGIAAGTTALAAVIGLRSCWSRELKGKAEFEGARNLARATYKLRDALRHCRSPFYSGDEFPEETVWDRQDEQGEASKRAYVYENRFDPVRNAIQEFDSSVLEAEALWDQRLKPKRMLSVAMLKNSMVRCKPMLVTK